MAKDAAVIGIDLGGTNVRLALVSPGGEILARWERATATMPHQRCHNFYPGQGLGGDRRRRPLPPASKSKPLASASPAGFSPRQAGWPFPRTFPP